MKIISIGEILWDVFDAGEHLGGAPFNFAAHAAQLGHEVVFVSAVGRDGRGRRALARVAELGLDASWIGLTSEAATGTVTVSLDPAGQPDYVIHRPAAYDFAGITDSALADLSASKPDWISFGTLHQMNACARNLTRRVLEACPGARRFYDVNLRRDSFTPALVGELLGLAGVVKLNEDEVGRLVSLLDLPGSGPRDFCRRNAPRFGWEAICVTRGANGCSLWIDGEYAEAPGYRVKVADTVGAGDAFSAAFVHGLGQGWPAGEIARFANRAGALVASRPGAIPAGANPLEVQQFGSHHRGTTTEL